MSAISLDISSSSSPNDTERQNYFFQKSSKSSLPHQNVQITITKAPCSSAPCSNLSHDSSNNNSTTTTNASSITTTTGGIPILPTKFTATSPLNKMHPHYDLSSFPNIRPITELSQFNALVDAPAEGPDHQETVIIDLRPFSQYSKSRVTNSLSICIPSTLLKRRSFHLSNIFKTMSNEHYLKLSNALNSKTSKVLNLIFYDLNSSITNCNSHLYQIIKKFNEDICTYDDKTINLFIINNGFKNILENFDLNFKIIDLNPISSDNSAASSNSLSDFKLPSATNNSTSFVNSIKKNQSLNFNSDSSIHIPEFKNKSSSLPVWLQQLTDEKKSTIDLIIKNFIRIETFENIRLESSINLKSKKHSPSICSPNCLCPSCDNLNYNLLNASEHICKNRYQNILPYEHSRVKLLPSPSVNLTAPNGGLLDTQKDTASNTNNQDSDDYFNANFINVPEINKDAHYIATQAPLPSTMDDFWKVIWHNDIELVISLTTLNENGIKKSDVYWENNSMIELIDEVENFNGFTNLTMRRIKITRRNNSKFLTQLNLKNWIDFGNIDSLNLLDFIQIKNQFINESNTKKPILVHCSAGCGRTGVFITVDLILSAFNKNFNDKNNNIWKTSKDLIYFTVQQLRKQRISMVQNLNQFILCYETILQYFYQNEIQAGVQAGAQAETKTETVIPPS